MPNNSGTPQSSDLPALTADYPILLSDDDPNIIIMVKMMLEQLGLSVMGALDSRDALLICQAVPVSLVISDIMKPVMNGFDFLERLRNDPATNHLAFMFLSANCQEVQRHGIQAGADAYMCKPFSRPNLQSMVQDLLLNRAVWQVPATFNPDIAASVTDTRLTNAAGPWNGTVWTTRRMRS
ncbi:MAG: response regulator [Anaerolineae bacterium]|nr:response regulator [Anaerolineae bacterium]